MPRFNVESEGKWACFSTIVDTFITPFMAKGEYEEWRKKEYKDNYIPLDVANKMSLAESLRRMSLNRTDAEFCDQLRGMEIIYEN